MTGMKDQDLTSAIIVTITVVSQNKIYGIEWMEQFIKILFNPGTPVCV